MEESNEERSVEMRKGEKQLCMKDRRQKSERQQGETEVEIMEGCRNEVKSQGEAGTGTENKVSMRIFSF